MVEKFLIDANSFMTPYRQYYAFDLVPTYWEKISKCTDSGRLILLDMVKAEIDKGKDDLADWLSKQESFVICLKCSGDSAMAWMSLQRISIITSIQ